MSVSACRRPQVQAPACLRGTSASLADSGAGRFSLGSWRIARRPPAVGSGGTDREHRAARRHRGGTSLGFCGRCSLFPELKGTWSSVFHGAGWQAAGALDVARACLLLEPALEGSASSWALPSPPASRLPVPPPVGAQMVAWCRDSQCLRGHRCGCKVCMFVYLCVSVSPGLAVGLIVSFSETQLVTPNWPEPPRPLDAA